MMNNGEISQNVAEYLENGDQKLPKFYHLLKTHKIPPQTENPTQWIEEQGYPIRGIISGRGGLYQGSGFVDHFLQPGMKKLPTFLQDTKDTLKTIEEVNEKIDRKEISLDGVGLATLDVEKMYTNMTENLGSGSCKTFLEWRQRQGGLDDEVLVTGGSILNALDLCIKNNYFEFDGKVYKQVGGVGTGVKLAPAYACLGLGKFEDLAFNSNQDAVDLILLWKRYIDDVFALFKGDRDQLQELVNWLNSLMPGVVKFTFDFSEQ